MAIQIGGTTVIDDSRNLVNVNDIKVGVVTIYGDTGDVYTPGTITCDSISVPYEIVFFDPPNGSTENDYFDDITLTFNNPIQAGIGTIELRRDSGIGTVLSTYTVGVSTYLDFSDFVLTITPSSQLPGISTIFVVVPDTAIENFSGVNVGGASTEYSFTTRDLALGDPYEGGFLICQNAGTSTRYVVAPACTQVVRTFYCTADAAAQATALTGCTGWYLPSLTLMRNPGLVCQAYWDSVSSTYWSSTITNSGRLAACINMTNGTTCDRDYCISAAMRTFRNVSY